MKKINWLLLIIVMAGLLVRLYQLDSLPGELWGDTITHYRLAEAILKGDFFLEYRFLADGPLFSYFAAFVAKLIGLSFYSLKLTTTLIGTACIVTIYYFTLELIKKKSVAYVASFFMAFSFWGLSFSRQGKPHMLIPLLVTLSLFFALRQKVILAGILLGLGLCIQSASWGMLFVFLPHLMILLIGLLTVSPTILSIVEDRQSYFSASGYYGEKLGAGRHLELGDYVSRLSENIVKNITSFNLKGDVAFRQNIPGHPSLDMLSGILFVLGMILLLRELFFRRKTKLFWYFFFPFWVIQIPSLSDVSNPQSVPNIGRMIGVLPFVCIAVAYGLVFLVTKISQLTAFIGAERIRQPLILAVLLGAIFIVNFYNFFIIYPRTLPNGNTPFGKIIARHLDTYPQDSRVFVAGCCWGEWGQPEPGAIEFSLRQKRTLNFVSPITSLESLLCENDRIKSQTKIVVVAQPKPIADFNASCLTKVKQYQLISGQWSVATVFEGERR